jgi:hypothetical protein
VAFGTQVGSVKELKQQASRGSGLISFIPKEEKGTMTVRFLQEPDEWTGFREVYDQIRKKSWPVPPDDSMPGTPTGDDRVSKRFLVNAVQIDCEANPKSNDKVIALQLPADLVTQLLIRYDKYNTILDRDYELGRTGSNLDTTYYLTPEPAMDRKVDKYKLLDLEEILMKTYEAVWGESGSDTTSQRGPAARKATGATKKRAPVPIEDAPDPESDGPDLVALAAQADDDDDADAAAELTKLADQLEIDPEEYATWAEVAEKISEAQGSPEPGPEAEPDDGDDGATAAAEAEPDQDSWQAYGVVADDSDSDQETADDFIEQLTAAAATYEWDVNDYPTWEELGIALDAEEAGGEKAEAGAGNEKAEGEWSEEDCAGKSIGELRTIARDIGITTTGLSKAQLIEAIVIPF